MIYEGRNADQMRTSNAPWFKLDFAEHLYSDDAQDMVLGGSAIDAPEYIASGSTAINPATRPYVVMLREVRREF